MATRRRILVVHYSQTGQLTRISESFVKPFEAAGMEVDWLRVVPSKPYNFPWSAPRFFDAFPESVDRIPCKLEPLEVKSDREYDLVILAYQVWFMNISIPMNSFLKLPEAAQMLKGKPVVTLIGCRNMWVMAQEDMKQRLVDFGSNLVGNVALIDRTSNLVGLITVLGWMLKGKKEKLFGFMPASGVSEEDIAHCGVYGQTVLDALQTGQWDRTYDQLIAQKSAEISPSLLLLEKRGSRLFKLWSQFIAGGSGQPPGHPARLRRARMLLFLIPIGAFILGPIMAIISKIRILFAKRELESEVEKYIDKKPVS